MKRGEGGEEICREGAQCERNVREEREYVCEKKREKEDDGKGYSAAV